MPSQLKIGSPYSSAVIPSIPQQYRDTFLNLFHRFLSLAADRRCSMSSTASAYRMSHKARRKRAKLRQRRERKGIKPALATQEPITVGFNNTIRHLEALASRASPSMSIPSVDSSKQHNSEGGQILPPIGAIFVTKALGQLALSHLPTLSLMASAACPELPHIRIITLDKEVEGELLKALRVPRVSMVGVKYCTREAKALLDLLWESVKAVDVPWFRQATSGGYRSVNIRSADTTG